MFSRNTKNYANREFETVCVSISQITIIFSYNPYNRVKIIVCTMILLELIACYVNIVRYSIRKKKENIGLEEEEECLFLIFSV